MNYDKHSVPMNVVSPTVNGGWESYGNVQANGIDILRSISSLYVKQRPSIAEAILGIAMKAKFDIFTDNQQPILHAYEESGCCQRFWCTTARRFTLHIMNNQNQEIMRINREFSCCAGCCWCSYCKGCQQEATIEAPPGRVIGTVKQEGSCWRMHYVLRDTNNTNSLMIIGPTCICDGACCCCCKNKFTIFGTDGVTEIGAIHKKYSGFCKESFTSADNFTYEVPTDMDVKMKAIVLGSLFLIDFTNFAMVPQNNS